MNYMVLTFQVTKKTKCQKPDIMRREWFSEYNHGSMVF
jgi:hypothetical protein